MDVLLSIVHLALSPHWVTPPSGLHTWVQKNVGRSGRCSCCEHTVALTFCRHSAPAALEQYLPTPKLFPGSPGLPQQERTVISAGAGGGSLLLHEAAKPTTEPTARAAKKQERTIFMVRAAYQSRPACQKPSATAATSWAPAIGGVVRRTPVGQDPQNGSWKSEWAFAAKIEGYCKSNRAFAAGTTPFCRVSVCPVSNTAGARTNNDDWVSKKISDLFAPARRPLLLYFHGLFFWVMRH